jgi:hypothetical protein
MLDPFVVLTPVLVLGVMALVWYIGCDWVFGLQSTGLITPPKYRQGGAPYENFQGGTGNSISTAMGLPSVYKGDLMVVWIWYESNTVTVSTVTDSAGNTYQRAIGPTAGTSTGTDGLAGWQQEIWYGNIAKNAVNLSITANFTGTIMNGKRAISPQEFNTDGAAMTVDQTASKTGTTSGTLVTVGTDPVSDPDSEAQLIFGAAIFGGGGGTQASGFTLVSSQQGNVAEYVAPPLEAAGTLAAKFSTGGMQEWIAQAATFKY